MSFIKSYLIGSLFGILSEIIVSKGNHHCIKSFSNHKITYHSNIKCLLSMTIFNLYGWGAVLLTSLLKLYPNHNTIYFFLFAAVLISLMECIGGKISYIINKKHTWNYPSYYLPTCSGYVSLISTLYFTVMLMFFTYIIYPLIS